jgi:hypothetical protein
MWGFGIYLTHLYNYLAGRKQKKKTRSTCDVCRRRYRSMEDMEMHRRRAHPNAEPHIGAVWHKNQGQGVHRRRAHSS